MTLVALALIVLHILSLILILTSDRAREARDWAFRASLVGAVVSLVSLAGFTWHGHTEWWYPFPALVACSTVTATGLSRLSNTSRHTYAAMMLLTALSYSNVLLPSGKMLALPWLGSSFVAWLVVRRRSLKTARVFALYIGTSAMLAALAGLNPKLLFFLALALCIKQACFPFHSWLPSFVETAPMGVVVTFITPQVGIFLHLTMLSEHLSRPVHLEVAGLGVLTALFGALLGSVQNNLKRVLAYLFISQSGLVAFGLENSNGIGHAGALSAWLAGGLGMAGFAMSIEALAARRGDQLDLNRPGRDFESTPTLATSFLLSGLAMVGLPGTLGFISEDLLVQGSVSEFPVLGYALIVVTAINAVTVMRCVMSAFSGPKCPHAEDLTVREKRALEFVLAMLFLLGLCPQLLLSWFAQ